MSDNIIDQKSHSRETMLACLREIAKMLPRGAEIEAFISNLSGDETANSDPLPLCLSLAEKLHLAPKLRSDLTIDDLVSYFGAPLLLPLANGNWVMFLGSRRQIIDGAEQERMAVYDPLAAKSRNMLLLTKEQLEKSWTNSAVYLTIELPGCSTDGRHTSICCLAAIVKHYGGDTDSGRLMHEYAISEDEPSLRLLRCMAENLNFASKEIKITFEIGRAHV